MWERESSLRFHYSKIAGIAEGDYSLTLNMENGEKLTISKMGGQHEPFKKALNDAMNQLTLKTQELIRSVAPAADSAQVRRSARLMRNSIGDQKIRPGCHLSGYLARPGEEDRGDRHTSGIYVRQLAGPEGKDVRRRQARPYRRLSRATTCGYLRPSPAPMPSSWRPCRWARARAWSRFSWSPRETAPEGAAPEEKDEEVNKSGGRWATYVFNIIPRRPVPCRGHGGEDRRDDRRPERLYALDQFQAPRADLYV